MNNTEVLDPDIWNDITNNKPIGKLLPSKKTYGMFNNSNINGTAWDVDICPIDVILLDDHKIVDRYTVEF